MTITNHLKVKITSFLTNSLPSSYFFFPLVWSRPDHLFAAGAGLHSTSVSANVMPLHYIDTSEWSAWNNKGPARSSCSNLWKKPRLWHVGKRLGGWLESNAKRWQCAQITSRWWRLFNRRVVLCHHTLVLWLTLVMVSCLLFLLFLFNLFVGSLIRWLIPLLSVQKNHCGVWEVVPPDFIVLFRMNHIPVVGSCFYFFFS